MLGDGLTPRTLGSGVTSKPSGRGSASRSLGSGLFPGDGVVSRSLGSGLTAADGLASRSFADLAGSRSLAVTDFAASRTMGDTTSSRPMRFSVEAHQADQGRDVPPPLEHPWWMKVHSDSQPVSNMEEVMEQFLGDSQAQVLERTCEASSRRFDARFIAQVMPGGEGEHLESMEGWLGHVTKFVKYRNLVAEKSDRQMELRMHRKNAPNVWDGLEFDSDNESENEQGTGSLAMSQSLRGELRNTLNGGGRASSFRGQTPTADAPPVAGRRASNVKLPVPARVRGSHVQPLATAGLLAMQKPGSIVIDKDKAGADEAASDVGDPSPRTPRKGFGTQRQSSVHSSRDNSRRSSVHKAGQ